MVAMNASLTYIVIYDVIRNQYFYLSDELTQEFFVGVNYICGLVLYIELSESDTEGQSVSHSVTQSVSQWWPLQWLFGQICEGFTIRQWRKFVQKPMTTFFCQVFCYSRAKISSIL